MLLSSATLPDTMVQNRMRTRVPSPHTPLWYVHVHGSHGDHEPMKLPGKNKHRPNQHLQWRIQGGGGGAQQARAPLKFD